MIRISSGDSRSPFITKQHAKAGVKNAAVSAALSAGLTYAINKGSKGSIKAAGRVAGIAAGVSLAIDFVRRIIDHKKECAIVSQFENDEIKSCTKLNTHQG